MSNTQHNESFDSNAPGALNAIVPRHDLPAEGGNLVTVEPEDIVGITSLSTESGGMAETTDQGKDMVNTSASLLLAADEAAGSEPKVKQVVRVVEFQRDPGSVDTAAAKLLGIPAERCRAIHLPWFEKRFKYSAHLYFDLAGVEHKLPHNTNATQLWLIANLPEHFETGDYINLTPQNWDEIKQACREIQPAALFES